MLYYFPKLQTYLLKVKPNVLKLRKLSDFIINLIHPKKSLRVRVAFSAAFIEAIGDFL